MADGLVGADPDLTRALAKTAGGAGDTAGHIAREVSAVLTAAEIADPGVVALANEIDDELRTLHDLLERVADEIEVAGSSSPAERSVLVAQLWASLTDRLGAGFDPLADATVVGATAPISPTIAADRLARYLAVTGGSLTAGDVEALARDEDAPTGVRVAAQYFVLNPEVFDDLWTTNVAPGGHADAAAFRSYAEQNVALAVVVSDLAAWSVAGDDDPNGVSRDDLDAVAHDDTGRFDADDRAAAEALSGVWTTARVLADRRVLVTTAATRRVVAESPELAADQLVAAGDDPDGFVGEAMWFEPERGPDWLRMAMASTDDPEVRAEMVRDYIVLYAHTMPDVIPPMDYLHASLEAISVVDPSPVADGTNAAIYAAERRWQEAAESALAAGAPLANRTGVRLVDGLVDLVGHRSTIVGAIEPPTITAPDAVRTAEHLHRLHAVLTQDAIESAWAGFDGTVFRRPDGLEFAMANDRDEPTLEIRLPDGTHLAVEIGPP